MKLDDLIWLIWENDIQKLAYLAAEVAKQIRFIYMSTSFLV